MDVSDGATPPPARRGSSSVGGVSRSDQLMVDFSGKRMSLDTIIDACTLHSRSAKELSLLLCKVMAYCSSSLSVRINACVVDH